MEFQKADSKPKQIRPIVESHPEAYHTSRSLDFINELIENMVLKDHSDAMDCTIVDLK